MDGPTDKPRDESSLVLLDSHYVGNGSQLLANKQKSYTIPTPFTFNALKMLFYHFVCTKNKFLNGDQVTRDYYGWWFQGVLKIK